MTQLLSLLLALISLCASSTILAQPADALSPEPTQLVLSSFSQAKSILLAHHPSLQLQAASVKRAEADIQKAVSALLPRVEIGAGTDYAFIRRPVGSDTTLILDSRTFVPSATGLLSVTFSLSRLASLSSSELQRDARALSFSATRQQLLGALAASLLGVLSAERVAARTSAGYAAAEERMRITSRLAEVGSVTALNALRFSQDLSDAKSELVSAVEVLSQARRALGQALGLREAVGVIDNLDVQQLLSDCHPITQLDERLDRRAARKLVDSGAEAARAAKLAYLPELRLTSQYAARLTPALEAQLSGGRELVNDWSARANLAWTVFDGGSRSSDVTRAEADLLAQRADLEQLNIDTELEFRRSQRLVSVTSATLEAARASVESAREIDRLSRRALELGTATALEVVDAARRLRAVEVTLALREVEELAARVRQHMTLAICQ